MTDLNRLQKIKDLADRATSTPRRSSTRTVILDETAILERGFFFRSDEVEELMGLLTEVPWLVKEFRAAWIKGHTSVCQGLVAEGVCSCGAKNPYYVEGK